MHNTKFTNPKTQHYGAAVFIEIITFVSILENNNFDECDVIL